MSINPMYGFNPYMMSNSGLNDDFISNVTGFNNQYAQLAQQQALLEQLSLPQQPTSDTFEKTDGGSGLGNGLKFAAVGGIGAGAGAYYYGDKLGAGFVKDGKFADEILRAQENIPTQTDKIVKEKLAKAFRADAPEALTKAAKSIKWAKAGKFAAIAAGAGLVLGWMFGGNKA